jgi:hypothetical protein
MGAGQLVLRKLGTKLPIEVIYIASDTPFGRLAPRSCAAQDIMKHPMQVPVQGFRM